MKMDLDRYTEHSRRTSLLTWFPILRNMEIAQPRTEWVRLARTASWKWLDAETPDELDPELKSAWMLCQLTGIRIGYPLFLRSDLVSGKHAWKDTCFVEKPEDLFSHIFAVIEENETAGPLGVPFQAMVFREFIELEWRFKAFWGEMPVARERRYFVKDGEILCHHPYWPPDSIIKPSVENWQDLLQELNHESDLEVIKLSAYARQISQVLPGYWTLDFAKAKNGKWYFIDAAVGYISFHWEGCPHKLEEET